MPPSVAIWSILEDQQYGAHSSQHFSHEKHVHESSVQKLFCSKGGRNVKESGEKWLQSQQIKKARLMSNVSSVPFSSKCYKTVTELAMATLTTYINAAVNHESCLQWNSY
jgi:hypothetical protein